MKTGWMTWLGILLLVSFTLPGVASASETEANPPEGTEAEEAAPALNRDPRALAEAIQAWFDNHTRENAPPPADGEAEDRKKRPRRTRVNPVHGVRNLAGELAKTQDPAFVAAVEREGILLYRLYLIGITNEERIADIDARLPEMRLARYRTVKGRRGQRSRHVPNPKMINRVKRMESQRRGLLELRTELPPLWRALLQRITQSSAPISAEDNLPRFARAALLADEENLLKELFDRGLTIEGEIQGIPLLTAAVNADASRCFAFLLGQKATVDQMDRHGFTALHRAIQTDNAEMAKKLLDAGADRELRSRCRRLPASFVNRDNEDMCALFGIEKRE